MSIDSCWCEIVNGKRHVADGCPTHDPVAASVRKFADDLIDDLRIGEEVRERDAADTGERITLEELAESVGIDLDEVRDGA